MISMELQESPPEYSIYKLLARCPRSAPRGHDSLYENMISMDLQESAPEDTIQNGLQEHDFRGLQETGRFTRSWPHAQERPQRP